MITEEEKLDMGAAYYEDGFIDGVEKGKAEGKAEGLVEGKAEGLAEGKAEGLAEGKAEGEAKARREMAAALLKMGLDAQAVAEATQLSLGEVTVLREKS